ncbi:MAG: AarF/UbiB family protein [Nannocystales bacterium]
MTERREARAVTDDGREVVVKVQYPGLDNAVDSDLAHLKLAASVADADVLVSRRGRALGKQLRARHALRTGRRIEVAEL